MSIEELLIQMEAYRTRREQRDHRPQWLVTFIQSVAGLFEPLTDVGRVGYDCQADELGWLVCLYLGTTEIIGGPRDGQIEHASFKIDLTQIVPLFKTLDRFEWYSVSQTDETSPETVRSVLTCHGTLECGHSVRLELLHSPPQYIGSGLSRRTRDIGGDDTVSLNEKPF